MISKRSWKLAPLAALFALGLLMFSGGLTPSGIEAEVDGIDAPESISDGGSITVIVDTEDDAGDLIIGASGGSDAEFDDVSCSPSCSGEISDEGTDEVTIDTDEIDPTGNQGNLEVSLELTVSCDPGDIITITAEDDDNSETWEVECVLVNIVIIKDAAGADDDDEFSFSISGDSSCDDDFVLMDGDEIEFACDVDEEYTVTEDVPDGWTVTEIDCTEEEGAEFEIDEEAGEVVITLTEEEDELVECVFVNEEEGAGEAGELTVTVAPNTVNCNSISFISIVALDADGEGVADGTPITVSTNIGSLNQTAVQTTGGGGGATVIFTAPANSGGTATITATSGDASDTATIQVNCAAPTAVPPTAVPTTPPATGGTVSPPSTGDAGLAASGGSSWLTTAGALLMVASLFGGLVAVRRRA